jgi:hypothetical protein
MKKIENGLTVFEESVIGQFYENCQVIPVSSDSLNDNSIWDRKLF